MNKRSFLQSKNISFRKNGNLSFWRNKKVLITGASGFIGSNLTKVLVERGAKVFALRTGNKPVINTVFIKKEIIKNVINLYGNVGNFELLKEIIRLNKIKIVFHLAAQPLVEIGQESPINTFETNIRGTWNVLEAARINDVDKIVVASTTHVYGNNPNLPYREEYYPQPSRPYETSKACVDLLAQSYADTYNLPVEIPRFVNIYGPGDTNFSRLIPKVISAVLNNKDPHIWDVGAVRDFLYIDDAISAYLSLVEKELPNSRRARVVNFGTGKPIRVVTIARKLIRLSGNKKIKVVTKSVPEEREKEIQKQYIHISKAKRLFKWKPNVKLNDGLSKTFEWYKSNFDNFPREKL